MADGDSTDAWAATFDNASHFVPEHNRRLEVERAIHVMKIAVAKASGRSSNHNLAGSWLVQEQGLYVHGLAWHSEDRRPDRNS